MKHPVYSQSAHSTKHATLISNAPRESGWQLAKAGGRGQHSLGFLMYTMVYEIDCACANLTIFWWLGIFFQGKFISNTEYSSFKEPVPIWLISIVIIY